MYVFSNLPCHTTHVLYDVEVGDFCLINSVGRYTENTLYQGIEINISFCEYRDTVIAINR